MRLSPERTEQTLAGDHAVNMFANMACSCRKAKEPKTGEVQKQKEATKNKKKRSKKQESEKAEKRRENREALGTEAGKTKEVEKQRKAQKIRTK